MKTSTTYFFTVIFVGLLPVTNLLADNFISESAALQCIEINKNMGKTQQGIFTSEIQKANLKSKINYLAKQIQKRRDLIENLDQQANQINNDNYNQLIDQFDELMMERKNTVALYQTADNQHLHQHEHLLEQQQNYSKQCVDIQISKNVYKQVCKFEKRGWCGMFSF